MFPQPSESEKQAVIKYVRSFSTPLVPVDSLYCAMEDEDMDHELVTWTLAELETEDRVWVLRVPDENDHGLPPGEFAYIPSDSIDGPLRF